MSEEYNYKYLHKIDSPSDLKHLDNTELKVVCTEIRQHMVDVISKIGGHFGGGLGTVELTVALHKVFNTPDDRIVWDTGHQAYPHKIITGRRDTLKTIRQLGGISGFLKRTESEYDAFGAGHASTSVSAALGMAVGRDQLKKDNKVIAVIGDGAMTGGLAYEAMNNSGLIKPNLIVVLNDNQMSIAPQNKLQLTNYFNEVIKHPEFNRLKGAIWDLTGKLDDWGDRIRKVTARLESGIKSIITPGMLFEAFGFRYFGPFNGHNLPKLIQTFEHIKNYNGPILVHVQSQKGKGYEPAEKHVQRLHGVTPFDKVTGEAYKKPGPPSYTSIFGKALLDVAKQNDKVVGITAAMPDGTGMNILQNEMPERCYDVGIAEEHAVTFAAGIATEGIIPVVAIYSTFMQRAFDQIIHDVALQKLHVVFILDRAGLVGADGPTHHGVLDLSFLRMVPGLVLMAPKDEAELRNMVYSAVQYGKGPIAIRYPRGNALGVELKEEFEEIPLGKYEVISKGDDVALLAVGNMVDYCKQANDILSLEGIKPEIINARFVKPLDTEMIDDVASRFSKIITLEENSLVGGFGSAVIEYMNDKGYKNEVLRIGLPDGFVEHGTQAQLHDILGIDSKGIASKVKLFVKGNKLQEVEVNE